MLSSNASQPTRNAVANTSSAATWTFVWLRSNPSVRATLSLHVCRLLAAAKVYLGSAVYASPPCKPRAWYALLRRSHLLGLQTADPAGAGGGRGTLLHVGAQEGGAVIGRARRVLHRVRDGLKQRHCNGP